MGMTVAGTTSYCFSAVKMDHTVTPALAHVLLLRLARAQTPRNDPLSWWTVSVFYVDDLHRVSGLQSGDMFGDLYLLFRLQKVFSGETIQHVC